VPIQLCAATTMALVMCRYSYGSSNTYSSVSVICLCASSYICDMPLVTSVPLVTSLPLTGYVYAQVPAMPLCAAMWRVVCTHLTHLPPCAALYMHTSDTCTHASRIMAHAHV
jgi:hypothetical protein